MFSRNTLINLAARSNKLRNKLHQLDNELVTGSDGGRYDTVFQIKMCGGYWLLVSIPSDKNSSHTPADGDDSVIVETSLIKDYEPIYDDELGYPIGDIRTCAYNAQAILAEHKRLTQKLIERS